MMRHHQPNSATVCSENGSNAPGPMFICGRQRSGNTVTACVFGQADGCLALAQEGQFFEHRQLMSRLRNPAERATKIVDLMNLHRAREIVDCIDKVSESQDQEIRDQIIHWACEHPDADALRVYRHLMQVVLEATKKRFWVQKATSYIFYGHEILRDMPDARMLYLVRNPYDICASVKRGRREKEGIWKYIWGAAISWNKGIRLVERLKEAFPTRVHIMRYEDMVCDPEKTFRKTFEFVGIAFKPRYLQVPHVHAKDAQNTLGLNRSRLFAYQEILSPSHIAAIDMTVDVNKVAQYYGDLPHRQSDCTLLTKLTARAALALAPLSYVARKMLDSRHNLSYFVDRTVRRIR